jgi:thiol-disulfide isomerase/thioredoxin
VNKKNDVRNKSGLYKSVTILVIFQIAAALPADALPTHVYGHYKGGSKTIWLSYWLISSALSPTYVKASVDSTTNTFEFHIDLKYPTFLQIENNQFVAIPGDTVKVDIVYNQNGSTFKFKDQRRGRDFFGDLLQQFNPFPYHKYGFDNQAALMGYKKAVKQRHDSTLAFVEKYFKSGDGEIAVVARNFLKVRYYDDLLYPMTMDELSRKELPTEYVNELDPALFENESLLGFREFIMLLSYYNRYFNLPPESRYGYDSATIAPVISSAHSNFSGKARDYLLLFIFSHVSELGSIQSASQISYMYEHLVPAFAHDPIITSSIEQSYNLFRKLGAPLPAEILTQRIRTLTGSTIPLQDVLSSDKVVYIDVWASWCGPCIAEMEVEKKLIAELKGVDVKFVLISVDENFGKWKSSVTSINIAGQHYFLQGGIESPLIKYLSFREIPRYLIFDRSGRLVSRDAPRPGKVLKDKSILLDHLEYP